MTNFLDELFQYGCNRFHTMATLDPLSILEHLRHAPVLRRLPLGELDRLVSRSRVRDLANGERLIETGTRSRSATASR